MKKRSEKLCLAQSRKGWQGEGPRSVIPSEREGSRRRFLALLETRISPGACPELCRRGRNDTVLSLRAWRSFGFAKDMLGAINFLEVVLSNSWKVRIFYPPSQKAT